MGPLRFARGEWCGSAGDVLLVTVSNRLDELFGELALAVVRVVRFVGIAEERGGSRLRSLLRMLVDLVVQLELSLRIGLEDLVALLGQVPQARLLVLVLLARSLGPLVGSRGAVVLGVGLRIARRLHVSSHLRRSRRLRPVRRAGVEVRGLIRLNL